MQYIFGLIGGGHLIGSYDICGQYGENTFNALVM
jgi:hypothetical protein